MIGNLYEGHRAYVRQQAKPISLADAVAAFFAADSAFELCTINTPDWQFRQLEDRALEARAIAIEALQREGISRAHAERMLP